MSSSDKAASILHRTIATWRDDRSIGAILIDAGKLKAADAERILRAQKEKKLRFGEAAVKLGLVSEADLQFALSRQFDYPYLQPGQDKVSSELIAAYQPFSAEAEELRALRSQIMLRWLDPEKGRKAFAVVSPERGEGRSFIAANLAVVFSQLGENTLVIDADMRHPRQHAFFNLEHRMGLSSILSGRASIEAIQQIPSFADLSVLAAGPVPPNPQELLARPAFAQLLSDLGQKYDVIILDTPAGAEYADAQTLAVRAGAALVVARLNRSRVRAIQGLGATLTDSGADIIGTAMGEF